MMQNLFVIFNIHIVVNDATSLILSNKIEFELELEYF